MKTKLQIVFLIMTFAIFGAVSAAAQNMSGTVKTSTVKFAPGKNSVTVRGTAVYAMSYIYTFKVKKGQTISVGVDSKAPELTFSIFAPKSETELAFQAREWTDKAPATGIYTITLVSGEDTGKIPYGLSIKIR